MQCFLRKNECLTIGSVVINVLDVMDDCVKLGITDPDATPAYREEWLYVYSDQDDVDEGDQVNAVFEPYPSEISSPFAFHVL